MLKKKYRNIFIGGFIFALSTIGMVYYKEKLEQASSGIYEVYFNVFRSLFFITLLFLVLEWVIEKWKEIKALRNDKVNAELLHLKNQVSPHFFFNTLNTLYGLIKKDQTRAQEFVIKLSDLMRYSIYGSDHGQVPISKEIDYIDNFLDLNRMRYHKDINLVFQQEVENMDIVIHPLLLIILVENAFKHGVEKLVDNSYVYIDLKSTSTTLSFRVENNYEEGNVEKDNGVGLTNLAQRLEILYPDKHSLKVEGNNNIFYTSLELQL